METVHRGVHPLLAMLQYKLGVVRLTRLLLVVSKDILLVVTGNASRNIPDTMCGLVETFLLTAFYKEHCSY